mmetsp:Transcript_16742/g.39089  ORF Transcript_16742/g.39089 Transcript_16742/m.39089 type:complete len:164 (-) Transcript_16742:450-941(-)
MTRASEEAAPPRPLPKTTSSRRGKSLCPQHDATVRTREEAEEAERLAGEKVVRSVEAMSGPTERGVRPWKRRDRAAYGGVESLGVGVDASATPPDASSSPAAAPLSPTLLPVRPSADKASPPPAAPPGGAPSPPAASPALAGEAATKHLQGLQRTKGHESSGS